MGCWIMDSNQWFRHVILVRDGVLTMFCSGFFGQGPMCPLYQKLSCSAMKCFPTIASAAIIGNWWWRFACKIANRIYTHRRLFSTTVIGWENTNEHVSGSPDHQLHFKIRFRQILFNVGRLMKKKFRWRTGSYMVAGRRKLRTMVKMAKSSWMALLNYI